ncbi:MAG TPA: hypothetical protein VMH00_08225 [Candidatus Limnocylindrales bacterium]|nr:hypothetical protein [Candidatus Limnocylindrales bacterium]
MKKVLSTCSLFAMLLVTIGLATTVIAQSAHAQEMKTMSWTGWISDSMCGAKGANANHKDCAMKCVKEKGASYVFVDTTSKKIMKIHNQDAVSEANLGQEVKVTGHMMKDGQIHVDSISNAMAM